MVNGDWPTLKIRGGMSERVDDVGRLGTEGAADGENRGLLEDAGTLTARRMCSEPGLQVCPSSRAEVLPSIAAGGALDDSSPVNRCCPARATAGVECPK
jgi:hypothetical protein